MKLRVLCAIGCVVVAVLSCSSVVSAVDLQKINTAGLLLDFQSDLVQTFTQPTFASPEEQLIGVWKSFSYRNKTYGKTTLTFNRDGSCQFEPAALTSCEFSTTNSSQLTAKLADTTVAGQISLTADAPNVITIQFSEPSVPKLALVRDGSKLNSAVQLVLQVKTAAESKMTPELLEKLRQAADLGSNSATVEVTQYYMTKDFRSPRLALKYASKLLWIPATAEKPNLGYHTQRSYLLANALRLNNKPEQAKKYYEYALQCAEQISSPALKKKWTRFLKKHADKFN